MWHYVRNNQYFGPVDDAAIDNLIANRTIIRHTPVWREGMPEWLEACQTELKDKFSGVPPTPPSYAGLTRSGAPVISYNPSSFMKLWRWFAWLAIVGLGFFIVGIAPMQTAMLGMQSCFFVVVVNLAMGLANQIVMLTLLYRCWSVIQDGKVRTSPGKAVGFYFIPFFNIYWCYVLYVGLAKDINRYCRERHISGACVNERLVLTWFVLSLVWMLIWYLVFASSVIMLIAAVTMLTIIPVVIMKQFADAGIRILENKKTDKAACGGKPPSCKRNPDFVTASNVSQPPLATNT